MRFKDVRIIAVALLVGTVGCAGHSVGSRGPEGGTWSTDSSAPASLGPREPEVGPPNRVRTLGETVTLERALSWALEASPDLAAGSWEVRMADARVLQAGLRPNPELEIEVEDFGGHGERREFGEAAITPMLSQRLELGGKRSRRMRLAALERDMARWHYESMNLQLRAEVTKAFVDVLAAQESVALAEELAGLSERTYGAVSERVRAGRVSPLEETKAEVVLATSRIRLEHAKSDLRVARRRLAATWGSTSADFRGVEGEFDRLVPIPPREAFVSRISGNPDIARWDAATERWRAAVNVEKAGRVPDLTVHGGLRRYNDTDDHAYVMGISLPIPLFDRNQGGVLESERGLEKAVEERRAAEVRVRAELWESYEALSAAHSEALLLRDVVLPAAERAFEAAGEGYKQGRVGYLEVLDAQRTYFEARVQYVGVLTSHRRTAADVERLIGGSLSESQSESP